MSNAEFEGYDAFNNRRGKSKRDAILIVEVTCVLSCCLLVYYEEIWSQIDN